MTFPKKLKQSNDIFTFSRANKMLQQTAQANAQHPVMTPQQTREKRRAHNFHKSQQHARQYDKHSYLPLGLPFNYGDTGYDNEAYSKSDDFETAGEITADDVYRRMASQNTAKFETSNSGREVELGHFQQKKKKQ